MSFESWTWENSSKVFQRHRKTNDVRETILEVFLPAKSSDEIAQKSNLHKMIKKEFKKIPRQLCSMDLEREYRHQVAIYRRMEPQLF